MSVTLRKRQNSDGTTSLRLDIYIHGEKKVETLKHLQLKKASTLVDRENNKERMRQAQQIAVERAAQLEANNYNMDSGAGKKTIVVGWMKNYVEGYTKKDKRNMEGVLNRFTSFLAQDKQQNLTFGNLDALLIEEFIDYLQQRSKGEGARSYYARFKKMIKHAYRKGMMSVNVLDLVERKATGKAKKKETLTLPEISTLAGTPIQNTHVMRAALFCSVTGLAWIDVKELKWENIKIAARQLEMVRTKLAKENVTVTIPLNETAMKLLDKPEKPSSYVFKLPSANGANKTLKAWLKRAGINKKITWHNLRHSYGTNLILTNVDILTTSKLLGHSSIKETMRYVTAAEEMKRKGTDNLNFPIILS